jgi:hypothetical protein
LEKENEMTLVLTLTPEEEAIVRQNAAEQGVDAQTYLQRAVSTLLTASRRKRPAITPPRVLNENGQPMTGAQIIVYWEKEGAQGVFADRPEDSPELARILRQEAERRDWSQE